MSKLASQYTFNSEEFVTLALKELGIHEGYWTFSVNFKMGAGNFGTSPNDVMPSVFVSVEGIGIQKVDIKNGMQTPPLTYDAAQLNPRT